MGWSQRDIPNLTGTVAVVTGANGGLGLETTRELARRGAWVVMASRDQAKAAAAEAALLEALPEASLEVRPLDLASLASVRSFATAVLAAHPAVDLLVDNAGVMGISRAETVDGFEMQIGVNHLADFALTALLLPALIRSGDGRVVTVTSSARFVRGASLDADDPHMTQGYDPWRAYGQSKLANLQFAIELDHRLRDAEAPVRGLCADPGFVSTDLQANSARDSGGWSQRFFHTAVRLVGASPLRGALPQLRAATDPAAEGGTLFGLRYRIYGSPMAIPVPDGHRDPSRLRTLWDVSELETGMRFDVAEIARGWLGDRSLNTISARFRRVFDTFLSIGAYPEEPEPQRARRRIMIGSVILITVLSVSTIVADFAAGFIWVGWGGVVTIAFTVVVLAFVGWWPRSFPVMINLLFVVVTVVQLLEATLFGGLFGSGLVVMFGLIVVLAALVAVGVRPAIWWCLVFVLSVVYAAAIEGRVEPTYVMGDPATDAAFNLVATGVVTLIVLIYFVRQRDRFQKESDDLLHNILPDGVARRLKAKETMIADSFDSASVLFADVVGFTPMSSRMSPPQLVGLLDEVFTAFDGFVAELGLEKIKTVGDAYMVAAGVPSPRPDHAEAIADLALQIRDHVAAHAFGGRRISTRIGINSGPVVAGIIGRHKFAYDLWGDVVNTASRMESEGVPGSIQVSAATYELIRHRFVCDPRGLIPIRGKGEMETYLLVSRRTGDR